MIEILIEKKTKQKTKTKQNNDKCDIFFLLFVYD